MTEVTIYTDGACRGNPGPGGWAAVLTTDGKEQELSGAEVQTTNNRMELIAAIRALEALQASCEIDLYTDSEYVRNGITTWIVDWKRRDWRTVDRTPVKNVDLWRELDALVAGQKIVWHWVKGHSGNPGNERVDRLANAAIDALAGAR